MFHFRKIPAHSERFQIVKSRFQDTIDEFSEFLDFETSQNPQSVKKKSGKSSSYSNYLIRLYIILSEHKDFLNIDIKDSQFINKLNEIIEYSDFQRYNQSENYFPSATIASYTRFINRKKLDADFIDEIINQNIGFEIEEKVKIESTIYENFTIKRSIQEKKKALINSKFRCEFDTSHTTFYTNLSDEQFLEGHHLIPLSQQKLFNTSIDISENIISLCPNCHRRIHYGKSEDVKKMVTKFYKSRANKLKSNKIDITLSELFMLYGL